LKVATAVLLSLAGLISGCSLRAAGVSDAAIVESLPPPTLSMSLIGRYGLAHACPVDGLVVTAAHVAIGTTHDSLEIARGYVYQQGERQGHAGGYAPLASRDLAQLLIDGDTAPLMARRAHSAPAIGDEVVWQQYNLTDHPMRIEVKRGEITELAAGHVAFEPAPQAGASGGCLFDSTGDVVGVIVWTIGFSINESGVAALLAGAWWPGS